MLRSLRLPELCGSQCHVARRRLVASGDSGEQRVGRLVTCGLRDQAPRECGGEECRTQTLTATDGTIKRPFQCRDMRELRLYRANDASLNGERWDRHSKCFERCLSDVHPAVRNARL